MAMYARPVPLDPYNPARGTAHDDAGGAGGARYPSPLLPIRVPVFAPVLFLNDWLVRLLSVGTAGGSGAGGGGAGHRRALSDGVESIEEGDGAGMDIGGVRAAMGARVRVKGAGAGAGASRLGRKFD